MPNANTARFQTLSNNLVGILDALGVALESTDCENAQAKIFAAARMVQKTARESNFRSRFDAAVNMGSIASVFSDHDYKFSKYRDSFSPMTSSGGRKRDIA